LNLEFSTFVKFVGKLKKKKKLFVYFQEFEIDKLLGIKGPEDVAKIGIEKYNAECRKIVMRYASEWETIVTRLGRWIGIIKIIKFVYTYL